MGWNERRRRDERGGVAVLVGVAAIVLVMITAFAVDLGVQRAARRDMQALADAVALDLARLVDGRAAQQIVSGSSKVLGIEAAKNASEARNEGSVVGDDPTVTWTLVDLDPMGEPVRDASGDVVSVTGNDVPEGVYVTATTAVGFGFALGSGGATRSALGVSESAACYQLGSYAASINPSTSDVFGDLLKPILGASTMNLVGYDGLASADVSLLDLIHAPSIGVGTVDELLALPDLTVGDLFLASASVLTGQGKLAEAAVFNAAATSIVAPFVLDFDDILAIDGSSDAVLNTHLNALDLLVGSVFLANGANLLDVHNLQAELGSVGVTTGTELRIIEKARRWCTGFRTEGPETSQLTFRSSIKVQPSNSPLVNTAKSLLRLVNVQTGSPDATLDLRLNVDLAGARAALTDSSCDPDVFEVDVWTNLLTASLTASAHVKGDISGKVNLLGIGLVDVVVPVDFGITIGASAFKPAATAPTHVTLSYPPLGYGDHVSVGSGDLVLPDVTITETPGTLRVGDVTAKVLGVPTTVPTADLLALVTPVINNLLTPTGALSTRILPLVQPVADKVNDILVQLNASLGMNLGGADVYGLEESTCGSPQLRG